MADDKMITEPLAPSAPTEEIAIATPVGDDVAHADDDTNKKDEAEIPTVVAVPIDMSRAPEEVIQNFDSLSDIRPIPKDKAQELLLEYIR